MKKGLILILFTTMLLLLGCGDTQSTEHQSEKIIDVNQFSRISSAELVEILGEPETILDYEWKVPSTQQSIVGKLYIYDQNKFEFILFDDSVVRLNVYSGTYMGYDETTLRFENEAELFSMFDISPNDRLKKVSDTGYELRYTPVSDTVAELRIIDINDGDFGEARITYNLNYY